jgi:Lysyl oxidase
VGRRVTRARLAALTALLTLGPVVALVPSAASQGSAAVLPDLIQDVPKNVGAGRAHAPDGSLTDGFAISFDSAVRNVGPGPMHLSGSHRDALGELQVVQVLHGGPTEASPIVGSVPGIGRMRYVTTYGHRHWHMLRFERYALRSLTTAGVVVRDHKQGFCLSNGFANGWCSQDQPKARSVDMGLKADPTYADVYKARVEGQEIGVTRTSAPTGRYDLVHTANPSGRLREVSRTNDSSSVELSLRWPADPSRAPRVQVLKRCPGSATCGTPQTAR